MPYLQSYKKLSSLMRSESFEPMLSWGIRMALAGTMPVIWGLYTSRIDDAVWMALTAEAVSWVELKGSFTWRVRTLLAGAVFAVFFALLGTATGSSVWLSVILMIGVGFFATLLKNIGDRASGLAICVYLLFIICNAYPEPTKAGLEHRVELVAAGAGLSALLAIAVSLVMPAEQPFRRQIALIWRSIAALTETITAYNVKNIPETQAAIYVKEKDIRTAIDNSYQFYGKMVHQLSPKDNQQYQLAMVRKAAGLVSVNLIAICEELELIAQSHPGEDLQLKLYTFFNALKEAITRISAFVLTLKPEEKLLAISHLNRARNLSAVIQQQGATDEVAQAALTRVLRQTERSAKLMESAIQRLDQMGSDKPVFRSYSLIKTSFLLKPKYLLRNIRGVFSFSTLTGRYALRSAIAAGAGMFVFKWFHIDHGYWLPFSVMIIKQPYFGATLQKAFDRIGGTVSGVIAGGLLMHIPAGLHVKEAVLFLTFVLMVYYLRKNYAVAAFIITINLILLFNLEAAYNNTVMLSRVLCTIGGGMLAIASGFALLPSWDKKWLRTHLVSAIACNYDYFKATFYANERPVNWTRNKRNVETKNSNVFDSFNRYLQEPGGEKSELYYDLATYNVRITRSLNNIHMEQDDKRAAVTLPASGTQQQRIDECLVLFNKVMQQLASIDGDLKTTVITPDPYFVSPFLLNDTQLLYLEKLMIELKAMSIGLEKLQPTPDPLPGH